MAFIGSRSATIAELEWNKAIQLAETNGEEERLKELHYQFVLSLTDIRQMQCEPMVLQLAEKYLAMDSSNYKMHACLGLARLKHLDDRIGAIEGFRNALTLEPRDHLVLKALLETLWDESDLESIMGLFENEDAEIMSGRIRACIDTDYFQDVLFLAARESGKMEVLVESYEIEIARRWTEPSISTEGDPRDESIWTKVDEAFGTFNRQRFYSAGTALLTCRLAFLHQRYRGDSQAALRLWTTVFLEQSEVFGLCDVSSQYDMDTLPVFVGMFAELLYEVALRPDGAVDEETLRSLERLRYRHDVFLEHHRHSASLTNERNLNLFLANLYRQMGKDDEASKLLRQQFERGIELLSDSIDWNDGLGWHVLSKILFACGQKENAAIAQFLRRYVRYQPEEEEKEKLDGSQVQEDGSKTTEGEEESAEELQPPQEEDDDKDNSDNDSDNEEPPIGIVERPIGCSVLGCSMLYDCSNRRTMARMTPLFACMTCVHVQFCEDCYVRHISMVSNSTHTTADEFGKERRLLSVCSSRHEHIKVPPEGWRLKEDVLTTASKEIPVKLWLEALNL
jgi:tetratricopeptide (TPR) repeat protein